MRNNVIGADVGGLLKPELCRYMIERRLAVGRDHHPATVAKIIAFPYLAGLMARQFIEFGVGQHMGQTPLVEFTECHGCEYNSAAGCGQSNIRMAGIFSAYIKDQQNTGNHHQDAGDFHFRTFFPEKDSRGDEGENQFDLAHGANKGGILEGEGRKPGDRS
jgi:hypothetical protein